MTLDEVQAKSVPEPNTGCWLWLGGMTGEGYGSVGSTTEKYSRDWIAGRLLGMADTLEAMTTAPVRREPAPPFDLSGLTGDAQ